MTPEAIDHLAREGLNDVETIAPPKKRGRPPKPKGSHGAVTEQEAPEASPSRLPKSSRKVKQTKIAAATQTEQDESERQRSDSPMDVDEEEGRQGESEIGVASGSRYGNLFHQGIQSLPDTSMLADSTKKKPPRHRVTARLSSTIDGSLKRAIAKQVGDLQKSGRGSYRAVEKGKETQYHFHTISAGGASNFYMGPIQSQVLQSVAVDTSKPLAKLVDDAKKPGALFNVGGHVYSVDWLPTDNEQLQYLCVSASLEEGSPRTVFGERLTLEKRPARVQIWSIDDSFKAELKMVLCFDQGWISTVRWLPMSSSFDASSSMLGLISACMQDGSVGVYAVPRPSSLTHLPDGSKLFKVDPLVQLNVKKGVPTAMEWFNADKVAVAYSDGWVSIWSLSSCLKAGTQKARPLIFTRVNTSPITSLAWHSDGEQIFTSSFDGSLRCMQLAHPQLSTTIYHSREVSYSVVFSPVSGFPLMERPEADDIRSVDFINGKSQTTTLYSHLGRVRTMSVSLYHSHVASGSVDGTVKVVDLDAFITRSGKRGRKPLKLDIVLPIYRLDKNRAKEVFRFIENLAPQGTSHQTTQSSAAWDPKISLTAVRWNCNEEKQSWLVSAMACGLVRIDVVEL